MRRRQAAFTLIEVVVAFVLLVAVLATVIEIFSTGMARASDTELYSRALVMAQSNLATAGVDEPLAEGDKGGESEDHVFRWVLTVQRSPENDVVAASQGSRPAQGGYTLYHVESRVAWQTGIGTERRIALATLVLAQNK